MGEESGVDLGHAGKQALLVVVERVPRARIVERRERLAVRACPGLGRPNRVERRQLGIGRDDAQFLLPSKGLLAQRLITHVEAALDRSIHSRGAWWGA